MELAI
jgi:tetratricopeptide (TPR) repeat protein